MKILFLLETKDGIAGEFHYDWQFPIIPRIGENVLIENIFDEGKFIVVNDDGIKSRVSNVSEYVKDCTWKVKGTTWCKKEGEYDLIISMLGE